MQRAAAAACQAAQVLPQGRGVAGLRQVLEVGRQVLGGGLCMPELGPRQATIAAKADLKGPESGTIADAKVVATAPVIFNLLATIDAISIGEALTIQVSCPIV
jgi:hypothetical protein